MSRGLLELKKPAGRLTFCSEDPAAYHSLEYQQGILESSYKFSNVLHEDHSSTWQ